MTSKREKLQYAYVFFADLLTMAVSVLLAWLITDGLFGVLIPYTSTDWLQPVPAVCGVRRHLLLL